MSRRMYALTITPHALAPMAVLGRKLTLFSIFAKIVAALTLFGFDPMFVVLHLYCVA